jgi:hypothetical protein
MSKSMKILRKSVKEWVYALCFCGSPRKPAEARGSPRKPAEARGSPRKPAEIFLRLYKALLTIFCGGFLDDFLRRLFVYNFLRLYLFCFICSTKFVHAVQKSVAVFRGGGGGGGGGVCVEVSPRTACCCQKLAFYGWKKMRC